MSERADSTVAINGTSGTVTIPQGTPAGSYRILFTQGTAAFPYYIIVTDK